MRRLAIALVTAGIGGCSLTVPQDDPVQIKLRDVEGRLERIERVMTNQSLLSLTQRIDSLESELRTVHGQLEELQNTNEALRKQQRDLYADLDRRLSAASGAANAGARASAGTAGAAGEQALYTQAFDALRGANYPAAIAGFRQFLSTYSTSELADNAQYWLARRTTSRGITKKRPTHFAPWASSGPIPARPPMRCSSSAIPNSS